MTRTIDTRDLPTIGLAREFFVSDDCFDREMSRIFRRRWLFACHETEISATGDFVRVPVGTDSVIVIRTEDGSIRAMHNVCRHRGSPIVDCDAGSCRGSLICPYHGWSYRLDGSIRATPRMEGPFPVEDLSLHSVWVDTWNSMVFVSLATERPEPVSSHLAGVDFSAFELAKVKVAWRRQVELEANWKVAWENGLECYHCSLNHPQLRRITKFDDYGPQPSQIDNVEYDWFPERPLMAGVESVTTDGKYKCRLKLRTQGGAEPAVSIVQWHLSLFEIAAADDHATIMHFRPVSKTRTAVCQVGLVHEDALAGGDYEVDDLFELTRVIREQDDDLCELVQRGVVSTAFVPGPISTFYESANQNFIRVYRDAMAMEA